MPFGSRILRQYVEIKRASFLPSYQHSLILIFAGDVYLSSCAHYFQSTSDQKLNNPGTYLAVLAAPSSRDDATILSTGSLWWVLLLHLLEYLDWRVPTPAYLYYTVYYVQYRVMPICFKFCLLVQYIVLYRVLPICTNFNSVQKKDSKSVLY